MFRTFCLGVPHPAASERRTTASASISTRSPMRTRRCSVSQTLRSGPYGTFDACTASGLILYSRRLLLGLRSTYDTCVTSEVTLYSQTLRLGLYGTHGTYIT